jgi:hypothetical protein
MCEKCAAIDERIAHYSRIESGVTDKLTVDRINDLIRDLKNEKVALHPSNFSES